jgi:hypothetical protein
MPIQFRKTSIKSRRRTLGLAALGLIVNTITSHPKVDVAAMVNVAMMSRFAAAPLMASIGSLSRTGGSRPNDSAVTTPVASRPDHIAWNCVRARRAES